MFLSVWTPLALCQHVATAYHCPALSTLILLFQCSGWNTLSDRFVQVENHAQSAWGVLIKLLDFALWMSE